MATLYVGNIPWDSTEDEVAELFSSMGQVGTVRIIKDRETGKSKGFCFVDMDSIEEALKATDLQLKGRPLRINEAREREEKRGPSRGPSRDQGDRQFVDRR